MWLAEEPGEGSAGGDVVGDVEDMTAVILQAGRLAAAQGLYIEAEAKTADADLPTRCVRQRLGVGLGPEEARRSPPALEGGGQRGDRTKAGRKKQRMPPCARKPETPLADGDDVINSPALSSAVSHAVLWRWVFCFGRRARRFAVGEARKRGEGRSAERCRSLVHAEIAGRPGRIKMQAPVRVAKEKRAVLAASVKSW